MSTSNPSPPSAQTPYGATSIDRLKAALEALGELLGQPALEPKPDRPDWGAQRAALDEVDGVAVSLAELVGPAAGELHEDPQSATRLRAIVGDRLGDAAGLLLAAGRRERGLALLQQAVAVATTLEPGSLAAAGLADPDRFARLIWAWWLLGQGRRRDARKVARGLARGSSTAIAESAYRVAHAPTPIKGPPALFRVNGCGTCFFGERDHQPDGSYTGTRYLSFIFVPVVPLDAYRVANGEDGGWYFLGKVPLSGATLWWRRLVLLGLLLIVTVGGIRSHLGSEGYRLRQAIATAQEAEEEAGPGERAAVIDQYEAIINEFSTADLDDLRPAVEAFVRLSAEPVHSPLTVDHLAEAKRVLARYQSLPAVARNPAMAGPMVDLLERWADELGTHDYAAANAALALLEPALAMAEGSRAAELRARHHEIARALAGSLADEWPLDAIRQYVALEDDPEAIQAAGALIDDLGEGPSVWVELAPTVARWAVRARSQEQLDAARQRAEERVAAAQARQEDPEWQALLLSTEEEPLVAALAESPGDQEIAVALANLRMGQGNLQGAREVLDRIGPPGRMVMSALSALASVQFEMGHEAEADALLEQTLSYRLPAFEAARRAYEQRRTTLSDQLIERGRSGRLPATLLSRLERAPEAQQMEIFGEWYEEQLAADSQLTTLGESYFALSGVVEVAIRWGTIKLRRAQGTRGDERQALLDGAERAFLAISAEGQGLPSYHLGLGQVYHRMGKAAEGDRELGTLLADGPPDLRLAVARTYRDLGLEARSREVAIEVYEAAGVEKDHKEGAAHFLAILTNDLDEKKTWLERAGNDPVTKISLVELEGHQLLRSGELAAADRRYAEGAEFWAERPAFDAVAANNAAINLASRYMCTGDIRHLREAAALLDRSRSMSPDNAMVVGNLASTVDSLATAELVGRWVRLDELLLGDDENGSVLSSLSRGPIASEIIEAVRTQPSVGRAMELSRQEQVLAPRRVDGYQRLAGWMRVTRDTKGLGELLGQVEGAQIDHSQTLQQQARFEQGEFDEDRLALVERRLGHIDERLAELGPRGHGPTVAAGQLIRGSLLSERAFLRQSTADARAAAEAFAAAHARWPSLGADDLQADALVLLALFEAAEGSVAVREAIDTKLRHLGQYGLLAWLLHDDDDAVRALRSRPALAEAVALLREAPEDALGVTDSLVAVVAGDAALTEATGRAVQRPDVLAGYRLTLALQPDDDEQSAGHLLLQHLRERLDGG